MLIYIGDGSALHDIPARDLSQEEAEKFGIEKLLASGLYKMAETPKKAKVKSTQEADNASNNS